MSGKGEASGGEASDAVKRVAILGVIIAACFGGYYVYKYPARREAAKEDAARLESIQITSELRGKDEAAVTAQLGEPVKTNFFLHYEKPSVTVELIEGKVTGVSGNARALAGLKSELLGKDEGAVTARLGKPPRRDVVRYYEKPKLMILFTNGLVTSVD